MVEFHKTQRAHFFYRGLRYGFHLAWLPARIHQVIHLSTEPMSHILDCTWLMLRLFNEGRMLLDLDTDFFCHGFFGDGLHFTKQDVTGDEVVQEFL